MTEEINGKELYDANVLVAKDNKNDIELLLMFTDLDAEATQLRIYKARYDENAGESGDFVEDEDTFQAALDKLEFLGVDSSKLEEFREEGTTSGDLSEAIEDLDEVQVYFNGERASTQPIQKFVYAPKLDGKTAKALKEASKKDAVFKSYPITVNENQERFSIILKANLAKYGLETQDESGIHNVKVAMLSHPDGVSQPYSLKYHSKAALGYYQDIEEGNIAEKNIENVKKAAKIMTNKQFEKKKAQLSELFGFSEVDDFDQAMDDEETFYFKVESVNSLNGREGTNYFIECSVVSEDEYSDDSEPEA